MRQQTVRTTSPDKLLKALQTFAQKADWNAVAAVLSDGKITNEELKKVIPEPVIEFALLLRTPLTYEALAATVPDEYRDEFDRAKVLVDEKFNGIERHPAILNAIQERVTAARASAEDESTISGTSPDGPVAEFGGFEAFQMWIDSAGGLAPLAAFKVRGKDESVVFEATVDWDDLSFLASSLTNLLQQQFVRAGELSRNQQLDLRFAGKALKRLAKMQTFIIQITERAKAMGLSAASND